VQAGLIPHISGAHLLAGRNPLAHPPDRKNPKPIPNRWEKENSHIFVTKSQSFEEGRSRVSACVF